MIISILLAKKISLKRGLFIFIFRRRNIGARRSSNLTFTPSNLSDMNLELETQSLVSTVDIATISFEMIKIKLQDEEEGAGWSEEECAIAETEYIKFLALKRVYPALEIVPHKQIDIFWHFHILDTEKYAKDCDRIFGYFLHHYPFFGMNGDQDAQNLIDAFEETKVLYRYHFHDEYLGESPKCKAPKCRTACKPMKCR